MTGGYVIVGGEVGRVLGNLPPEINNFDVVTANCPGAYSELEVLYGTGKPIAFHAAVSGVQGLYGSSTIGKINYKTVTSYTFAFVIATSANIVVIATVEANSSLPDALHLKMTLIK